MYIKVNLQTLLDSLGGPGSMNIKLKEEVSDSIYKATQRFTRTLQQAKAAGFNVPDTIHVDSGSVYDSSNPYSISSNYDSPVGKKVR